MDYNFCRRTGFLFYFFVLVFFGLGAHLAYIQIVSGPDLSYDALTQQTQAVPLEIPPRGEFLDRNLKPLISYREPYRLVVFPAAIQDTEKTAGIISGILNLTNSEIESYLKGKPGIIPVDLDTTQINFFKEKPMAGVVAAKVKVRNRVQELASHIVGYIGIENGINNWSGKSGLELLYNDVLRGEVPGSSIRIFLDGKGRYISGLKYSLEKNKIDKARHNVVLTIDRDIQRIVEQAVDKAGIRDGAVVVMDVYSGDIAAMSSRPGYWLDRPENRIEDILNTVYTEGSVYVQNAVYSESGLPDRSFVNHSLSQYQPGSVFKTVVAAAALQEHVVSPGSLFLCKGDKDEIVKCSLEKGHGVLNFAQAVAVSCNPTFARVGIKLGAAKLVDYAKRFGLGQTEIIGYKNIGSDAPINRIAANYNLVNASLGQWPVEASVVQVTAMMNTVANNGVYLKPRLVRDIRDYKGRVVKSFEPDTGKRAVSIQTAKTLQSMLGMVTRTGTGKRAWVSPWGSAGKTGSAQVGHEKVDAWFSGYAPVDNPRYTVTVIVNDGESGGKTAAPVFKEIMQNILALESSN